MIRRVAGLTLIELMLVIALLAVLGTALFGFLWQAVDLWETGERGRAEAETLAWAMRVVRVDLAAARGVEPPGIAPRAVFLVDAAPVDAGGDGLTDARAPRMRFVRALHPAERGGVRAGGEEEGLVLETIRFLPVDAPAERGRGATPPEELGFRLARRLDPWQPGPLPAPEGEEAPATSRAPGFVTVHPGPLLGGVFEVAPRDGEAWGTVFDSTRGLLDGRSGRARAPQYRDASSREDPSDDVFPARIRVSLLSPRRAETRTAEDLRPDDGEVAMEDLVLARRGLAREGLARIGTEWVRGFLEGPRLVLETRGLFGTAVGSHPRGTRVRFAELASIEVPLATRRPPAPPPAEEDAP